MTSQEEFLLEEYKESIKSGQWLEEMIERKFKSLSILFLWFIGLIAFLLRNNNAEDFLTKISSNSDKWLILLASMFVFLSSLITILNIIKSRSEDVLRTSRANFIRAHFLKSMPLEFIRKYFDDPRLAKLNSRDIYSRPPWSLSSDSALYIIFSALVGGVTMSIILMILTEMAPIMYPIVLVSWVTIILIVVRLKLKRSVPEGPTALISDQSTAPGA